MYCLYILRFTDVFYSCLIIIFNNYHLVRKCVIEKEYKYVLGETNLVTPQG